MFHIVDGHYVGPCVYFLVHKSAEETLEAFKRFKAEFEKQTGKAVKRIRVDQKREWMNQLWERYFRDEGIIMETTTPYSSSQNGPGERGIRTTIEVGRCLLADSGLPKSLWRLALETAAYLQWFHPKSRTGGVTPWEIYTKEKPDISHPRTSGPVAHTKI
jgi:transposase InsO family protein